MEGKAPRAMTKSALALARTALAVARKALPTYAHRNSPKKFTPEQGRGARRRPRGRYRRQMRRKFPRSLYGQRWQAESVVSRDKRRMGSSLRATSWAGQKAEAYFRLLTHNFLLLLLHASATGLFNRAGMTQGSRSFSP